MYVSHSSILYYTVVSAVHCGSFKVKNELLGIECYCVGIHLSEFGCIAPFGNENTLKMIEDE